MCWHRMVLWPFLQMRQVVRRGDSRIFECHSGYTAIFLGLSLGIGGDMLAINHILEGILSLAAWKIGLIGLGAGQVGLASTANMRMRGVWAVGMLGVWTGLLAGLWAAAIDGLASWAYPAFLFPLAVSTYLTIFVLSRDQELDGT